MLDKYPHKEEEAIEWFTETKPISFKKDVKIEVVNEDSSSTEDEDVRRGSVFKSKIAQANKSTKTKVWRKKIRNPSTQ